MRTALLAAVSHDLRTPLASAKAAVASLRSDDVDFDDDDRAELLATADESLDRLDRLVANLLDMSRLQAGALGVTADRRRRRGRRPARPRRPRRRPAAPSRAAHPRRPARRARRPRPAGTGPGQPDRQRAALQPRRPAARGHRQRARRHASSCGSSTTAPASRADRWDDVFLPFQRLGDRDNDTGVGLGLALSRGLTEAMGGTLTPEETPGGGLTMIAALPADAVTRTERRDRMTRDPRSSTTNRRSCARCASTCAPASTTSTPPPTAPPPCSAAARHHPDLVVLDLGLPDMRRRRGHPRAARLDRRADHRAVRPGRQRTTRSTPSTPAPTTTSPSRSASTSCSPASARSPAAPSPPARPARSSPIGRHTVDLAARTVTGGDTDVRLTPTEWQLLESWSATPASCVSQRAAAARGVGTAVPRPRPTTCASTWPSCAASSKTDPAHPRHLLTEPGMGYRFQP